MGAQLEQRRRQIAVLERGSLTLVSCTVVSSVSSEKKVLAPSGERITGDSSFQLRDTIISLISVEGCHYLLRASCVMRGIGAVQT
jgi:hypothetical protein